MFLNRSATAITFNKVSNERISPPPLSVSFNAVCLKGAFLCWHFGTFYICHWGGGFPLSVDKEGKCPWYIQLILPVALHWNQYLFHDV